MKIIIGNDHRGLKLKEQIDVYKQKRKNWIIILCISILISILSIYINFMWGDLLWFSYYL